MLYFKDVPVLIEIGVAAIEVGIVQRVKDSERVFYAHFERVELTSEVATELPFIVASSAPHVFTMLKDLNKSPFLLVYNYLGKLTTVYTRDEKTGLWLKSDTAPEQVGDTVTKFSIRFAFNSTESRDSFLFLLAELSATYKAQNKISRKVVESLLNVLITDSSIDPVVLPVAVAKIADD